MSSYVLLDEFSDYVRDQIAGTDDTVKQSALDAAESMVNEFCQRTFVVAGASSSRSYTPTSEYCDVLRIHDATTVTAVVVNGAATTNYQTEPLNLLSWSGEARPIEQLRTTGGYWYWNRDQLTVTVTGTFGWAATPKSVDEATKIIAKDILQQRNNNSGVAGFGEYGSIRVRMNPIAIDLLKPYRRAEAFGVA